MPTELKGEALLDYYREAVRACFGDTVANNARLECVPERYQLNVGGDYPPPQSAARVREMADELLKRAKEER